MGARSLGWDGCGRRPSSRRWRMSGKLGRRLPLRPGSVGRLNLPRKGRGRSLRTLLPPTKTGRSRLGASSGGFGVMGRNVPKWLPAMTG
eukprot:10654806-Alexandrium_andersonii.AAC.1